MAMQNIRSTIREARETNVHFYIHPVLYTLGDIDRVYHSCVHGRGRIDLEVVIEHSWTIDLAT